MPRIFFKPLLQSAFYRRCAIRPVQQRDPGGRFRHHGRPCIVVWRERAGHGCGRFFKERTAMAFAMWRSTERPLSVELRTHLVVRHAFQAMA